MSNNAKYELGYDLQEALKREGIKETDLKLLREPAIPSCPQTVTDKQLALFFEACNKDVLITRKVIQKFFECRKTSPEFFNNRDPESADIQHSFENQANFYLPLTPDGHLIIYHQLTSPKPSDYMFDTAVKVNMMTIDSCLYNHGPRPGLIFLYDMKNVTLSHLLRPKMSSVKKYMQYVQEALPAKLKAIHVMNTASFFDKILFLLKPFIKADILEMLHLHTSNVDMEQFYAEHIPKSCLPKDLGGDLESVDELHRKHCKELIRLRDYFLAEEKQRPTTDEVKENSFKRLDID